MRNGNDIAYHAVTAEQVLRAVESGWDGLTPAEASARLTRSGSNALRMAGPTPAWKILLAQLRSFVVLLLAAAVAFSLLIGDRLDAIAISVVLVINAALGFFMELRARRAMHALLKLDVPRAVVARDGTVREIDAHELVPGDVIELDTGRSVPADCRLLRTAELRVNEAALTGESLPVTKATDVVPETAPVPDRSNMVYKGTVVVAGSGRAVVVGTGMSTELGRIGELVGGISEQRTPLEHRLDALGRRLALLALLAGAAVTGLGVIQGAPLARMVMTGIALAIAAVPEGLPAVATIALAVGVHRMARRNALVRRLPSVETLGSVTVVCADKTGTLTTGRMTVTTVWTAERLIDLTGNGDETAGEAGSGSKPLNPQEEPLLIESLRIGALANRAAISSGTMEGEARGDPTEIALLVAARKVGLERQRLLTDLPEIGEVPFSSERMLMATFHRTADGGVEACVKGAPDRVLALCTALAIRGGDLPLDEVRRREVMEQNRAMASTGLRVLALARARVAETSEEALRGLVLLGLVGMTDPPAPGVKQTIRLLRDAGIRTVMITGDQPHTAEAVARELGMLDASDGVLSGTALSIGGERRDPQFTRVNAYSRVTPEQKLQIVTAFQSAGDVVAMLGDGVNDAAALKKADVGVAMGRSGTDFAKEVAAVVLQDDQFSTIGVAVEEGRIIFDNIRKFVFYLFSCNLAEVLVLLGAGVLGMPVPLTPLQILWLNMVTDTFPALALALEPAEADVMRRPPRDPAKAILSRPFLWNVAFYAMLMASSSLAAFAIGLRLEDSLARAATIAFMTLALAQTFHLGNARSREQVITVARAVSNPYSLGAVVLVILLQLLAVELPPLASLLGTVPLRAVDWAIIIPLASLPALVGQARALRRR
jgi:P-type Ca2+ transporter type 2C